MAKLAGEVVVERLVLGSVGPHLEGRGSAMLAHAAVDVDGGTDVDLAVVLARDDVHVVRSRRGLASLLSQALLALGCGDGGGRGASGQGVLGQGGRGGQGGGAGLGVLGVGLGALLQGGVVNVVLLGL